MAGLPNKSDFVGATGVEPVAPSGFKAAFGLLHDWLSGFGDIVSRSVGQGDDQIRTNAQNDARYASAGSPVEIWSGAKTNEVVIEALTGYSSQNDSLAPGRYFVRSEYGTTNVVTTLWIIDVIDFNDRSYFYNGDNWVRWSPGFYAGNPDNKRAFSAGGTSAPDIISIHYLPF